MRTVPYFVLRKALCETLTQAQQTEDKEGDKEQIQYIPKLIQRALGNCLSVPHSIPVGGGQPLSSAICALMAFFFRKVNGAAAILGVGGSSREDGLARQETNRTNIIMKCHSRGMNILCEIDATQFCFYLNGGHDFDGVKLCCFFSSIDKIGY